jgi:hypothetical protein
MLLFGGVNLKSYCEGSAIYEFTLDNKQCAALYEETEAKVKHIMNRPRESGLSTGEK